ncbi:WD and tetratricopeptide repeats protein 1 [Prorops nasuta]|uniref:WD and tetratricopeptide repeats protein 1 n=1 Tax=Prorops nasuta TaxID=863751 RepID=UPI0034CEA976
MFPNIRENHGGLIDLVRQREIQESAALTVFKKLHVTENLISRLGLEKELNGHAGCVNCLEWNETGQTLASASDDMNVILWDPFRYEKKLVLQSGHDGNIFSVKFMPKSNDSIVVTGAADCRVHVHSLTLTEPMLSCICHSGRVKRIGTAPSVQSMFWTSGEDGLIFEYDLRTPHVCKSRRNGILVNLNNHMGKAEAKCIAVNPKRPELIAIGANDAYIRMFDRRMIKLSQNPVFIMSDEELNALTRNQIQQMVEDRIGKGDPEDNVPLGCAQYFIAGHLCCRNRNDRSLNATYLTFNADGNELLVNIGGEQIYLFDINDTRQAKTFFVPWSTTESEQTVDDFGDSDDENTEEPTANKGIKTLPPHVEEIKRQANANFDGGNYSLAITLYNKALSYCPTAAVLLANRAATYMKRNWDGDTYAALRDCQETLLLDPEHVKAHFRLARCLLTINRPVEAQKVMRRFQQKFPEYASYSTFKALKKDINGVVKYESTPTNPLTFIISQYEQEWRNNAIDYKLRFCGHCNTTTDIKEANFFGNTGQYIVAGSDDGSFFIWDRNTTNILRILHGDDRIVNCLQPHPYTCLLATSGIDPVIRLWSPRPEDGSINEREVQDLEKAASANQIRMNSDPFELMLLNMGYRFPVQQTDGAQENGDDSQDQAAIPPFCRQS